MWYESEIRMKALWSSDCRMPAGIDNVVNAYRVRGKISGGGEQKHRKTHESDNIIAFCLKKKRVL